MDRTLRRLDAAGKHYGIRATLTMDSVDRLSDIAHFVAENYPHCEQLHIEPVWESGRCLSSGAQTPESEQFAEQFLKALRSLPETGLRLVFSAARKEHLTNTFCSAGLNSFVVTSEGLVTSCYEVCEMSTPAPGALYTDIMTSQAGALSWMKKRWKRCTA